MTSLLLALLLTPQAYAPEVEAVMNRSKARAEKARTDAATPPSSRDAVTTAATALPVPPEVAAPFQACLDDAVESPEKGIAHANEWRIKGGSFYARQCLGFAYARAERWAPAIVTFEQAAEEAERAGAMPQSARLWAQAGNAALAGGDPAKARSDLDAALARGIPDGMEKGEVHLDRARALVALNDPKGARDSLDIALEQAPLDPLGWLLSATLARRAGEMAVAQAHIARAVQLSPDDASVALEEGNIAVLTGHDDVARSAWQRAVKIAPESAMGKAAADNLTRLPTG
jgi:tetratricopeptide (TPR) repeat protein